MKPLDVTPWEEGLFSEARLRKALWFFLVLGVLARAVLCGVHQGLECAHDSSWIHRVAWSVAQ